MLAEIPNLFGPGFTAQMTYYETPAGAKVFAAGAFTLAGQVLDDPVIDGHARAWTSSRSAEDAVIMVNR